MAKGRVRLLNSLKGKLVRQLVLGCHVQGHLGGNAAFDVYVQLAFGQPTNKFCVIHPVCDRESSCFAMAAVLTHLKSQLATLETRMQSPK